MQDGPLGRRRLLAKASVVVAITPRLVQWPASASACAEKASARVFVVGVAAFSSLGLEIGRCCFVRRADGAIGQYRPKVTEHHLTGDGVSVRVGDGDARYDTDRPSRSTAARGVGKERRTASRAPPSLQPIGLALAMRQKVRHRPLHRRCFPRIRRLRPHGASPSSHSVSKAVILVSAATRSTRNSQWSGYPPRWPQEPENLLLVAAGVLGSTSSTTVKPATGSAISADARRSDFSKPT